MRRIAVIPAVILTLGLPAFADDWQTLTTSGITYALTARVLIYDGSASQNFFDDGRTLYEGNSGESWGKWWAADGVYCSTWPPSQTPSCFQVAARGLEIRFTSSGGDVTIGHYGDLN